MSGANLWQCKECSAQVLEADMLAAPSPFDSAYTLWACPKCKQCDEGFFQICDEPGCNQEATCGWPTNDGGYRRTCSEHMKGFAK